MSPQKSDSERIDKHDELIEKLIEQQYKMEAILKELTTRTNLHEEELKEMRKTGIDVGKILEGMRVRFSIIQWLAVTAGAILVAYLFQHFLR